MFRRCRGAVAWMLMFMMLINMALPSLAAEGTTFNLKDYYDIEDHWAKTQIERLISEHVVSGKEEDGVTVVKPNASITRAEYVVLTLKGMFSETELKKRIGALKTDDAFTDTDGHWAKAYLQLAHDLGLASGYADGAFHPDAQISRAEAVTIMVKSSGALEDSESEAMAFSDLSTGHWAYKYVAAAKTNGLISGYPNNTFKPDHEISRAESMVVTDRYIDYISEQAYYDALELLKVQANQSSVESNRSLRVSIETAEYESALSALRRPGNYDFEVKIKQDGQVLGTLTKDNASQIFTLSDSASGTVSYDVMARKDGLELGKLKDSGASSHKLAAVSPKKSSTKSSHKSSHSSGSTHNNSSHTTVVSDVPNAPVIESTLSSSNVVLTWSAIDDASEYIVKRGEKSGNYTELGTTTNTTYTDTTRVDGTTYYYVVVASNDVGSSANSNEVVYKTVPQSPNLFGSINGTSGYINWSSANGANYYTLYRSTVSGGPYYAIVDNTMINSYTDEDLQTGTTYYYVVKSVNEFGESDYSNEVAVGTDVEAKHTFNASLDDDGDGLTNEQELVYGTRTYDDDTDGDGMLDGTEISLGTDPLNPDTDGDGIYDGAELVLGTDPLVANSMPKATKEAHTNDGKITVVANGNGNLVIAPLQVEEVDNVLLEALDGVVGKPIDISSGGYDIDSATITFTYDDADLQSIDENNLTVFYVNPDTMQLEALENVTVDTENNTVTGVTTHFSMYLLGDKTMEVDLSKIDIVFTIDQSGSMRSNDPNYYRISATERFVENIDETKNRVGLVTFTGDATIKSVLKNDKDALLEVLSHLRIYGGSTDIADGISKSSSLFDEDEDRSRVIILLTDGQSSATAALKAAKAAAEKGIIINTVALGSGADIETLESIAEETKGGYFYINDEGNLSQEDVDKQIELIYEKLAKQLAFTSIAEDNDTLPQSIVNLEFSDLYNGYDSKEVAEWYTQASSNLLTGNYVYRNTDLSLEGPGFNISVDRTYNSFDTSKGLFGTGFTSNLESKVVKTDSTTKGIVMASSLNVRSSDEVTSANKIGQLSKGTEVEILDRDAGGTSSRPWYKISFNGQDAYVAGWYISENEALRVMYPSGSNLIFNYNDDGSMATSNSSDDVIYIGRDGSYEYELVKEDQSIFYYDADGKVRAYTDRYGNPITFEYNSSDQIVEVTGAFANRKLEITYNSDGFISQITDPLNRTASYTYDDAGNLVTYTDMNGEDTTYTYDDTNRIYKIVDANGHQVVRNSYDLLGRMVRQYDGQNNIKYYIYDDNIDEENSISARYIIDENGNESKITFGPGLRPITVRDALGGTTEYTYYYRETGDTDWIDISTDVVVSSGSDMEYSDTFKKYQEILTQENVENREVATVTRNYDTDGNENDTELSTTTDTDAQGNVVKVTDSYGNIETFEYDDYKNLTSHTDKNGNETTYTYDDKVYLAKSVNPLGQATTYAYHDYKPSGGIVLHGLLKSKTDASGGTTTYDYNNGNNFMDTVTDAEGHTTSYTYDVAGRKLTETNGNGAVTTFEYDDMNRIVEVTAPDGEIKTSKYDGVGNLVSQTDFNGNKTTYTYDEENALETVTDPLGQTTTFTYDPKGNKTKEAYEDGSEVTYTYDELGRVIEKTDQLGYSEGYTYDNVGNMILKEDALGYETQYVYDKLNRVSAQYAPENMVTRYSYDDNGNVVQTKDAQGNKTTITYDALDRKIAVKDALGNTQEIEYDDVNRTMTTIDPLGNKTITYMDGLGQNVKVVDALGQTATTVYDGAGNVSKTVDKAGTAIQYTYNSRNQATKMQVTYDTITKQITYTYDANGNKLTETNAAGATTSYAYNANNQVTLVTYADGSNQRYKYDDMGRVVEVTDPNGHVTKTEYDDKGQTLTQTNAEGDTVTSDYNALGAVTKQTDGNGNSTRFSYDGMGRQTKVTDANGNYETLEYDSVGNNISRTDKNGNTTEFEYDAVGRPVQVTNPDGNSIQTIYDEAGRVITEEDARGNSIEKTYDALGRVATVTDQMGETESYAYDALDNMIQSTDRNGSTTKYTYDALGQLVSVTDSEGVTTLYTFDLVGNMASKTDGEGHTTLYVYDDMNRLVKETDPEGDSITYAYDNAGNMTARVDKNGKKSTFTYDKVNQLIEESHDGLTYEYTYDSAGHVETVKDSTGTTEYTYDNVYNTINKELPDGMEIAYSYDANGNETRIKDTTGEATSYTYDEMNRMKTVTTSGETSTYEYDANGNRTKLTLANGTYSEYAFDKANRLVEMTNMVEVVDADFTSAVKSTSASAIQVYITTGSAVSTTSSGTIYVSGDSGLSPDGGALEMNLEGQSVVTVSGTDYVKAVYTYTYDANGYQLSKDEPKGKTTYAYDTLGRLKTTVEPTGRTTTYTYDDAGNRATQTVTGDDVDSTITYTYDDRDRLLETVEVRNSVETTTEYTYDANGNQTQVVETVIDGSTETVTTATYTYDALNRLTKVVTDDGQVVENTYDFKGMRTSKTVDGVTTQYVYDGNTILVEETAGQSIRTISGIGVLAREADQMHYYIYNGHADVVAIVNSDGVMTNQYDYDVFGNVILSVEGYDNPFKYSGYVYDAETGYYYLNARYYDPEIARFITEDTYQGAYNDPLSLNRYTYCHNNPVIYYDPSGHMNFDVMNQINGYKYAINDAWNSAAQSVGDAWDATSQAVGDAYNSAAQTVSDTVDSTVQFASDQWDATKGVANDTCQAVSKVVSDTGKVISKAASDTGQAISQVVYDTGEVIFQTAKDSYDSLPEVTAVGGSIDLFASTGSMQLVFDKSGNFGVVFSGGMKGKSDFEGGLSGILTVSYDMESVKDLDGVGSFYGGGADFGEGIAVSADYTYSTATTSDGRQVSTHSVGLGGNMSFVSGEIHTGVTNTKSFTINIFDFANSIYEFVK